MILLLLHVRPNDLFGSIAPTMAAIKVTLIKPRNFPHVSYNITLSSAHDDHYITVRDST